MESNYIIYEYETSFERIDEILNSRDTSFEEIDHIPPRDRLTFTNGFYVKCSAMSVDIRDSSELPQKHSRAKLAKLYRAFLSESVAVMNGSEACAEVNIVGDCVWGVFNTPYINDIDNVFSAAARIESLIDTLNCKFKKYNIEQITAGIGISYGKALMIKAGYSGSGINDVVWMGEVVNEASKLASYGNETWEDKTIMVADSFYNNLDQENKNLLSRNHQRQCYHGDAINKAMREWYDKHCKDN